MLRVSSLGLGLPSSTSIALTCRLYIPRKLRTYKSATTTTTANLSSTPVVLTNHYSRSLHIPDASKGSDSRSQVPDSVPAAEGAGGGMIAAVTVGCSSSSTREAATEVIKGFMLQEDIVSLTAQDILIPQKPSSPTIPEPTSFTAGRPWTKKEVKPIYFSSLGKRLRLIADEIEEQHRIRGERTKSGDGTQEEVELPSRFLTVIVKKHLVALAITQDVEDAWNSYITLIDIITRVPSIYKHISHIPYAHLHRLTRLLAGNRPKTHRQYLRLLAVMTYLKHSGGTLMQHQYNALIDHAGKGWRKTREEEVQHAKRVAKDLEMGRLPGLTEDAYECDSEDYAGLSPDIYTFTTLLATAARALSTKELLNISSIMQKAGLPPNRITHLSLLRHFTQKRNLGAVRSTLQKMRSQKLELGVDGLNACMWAYGLNDRVDVVLMIYRLLRHNLVPETYVGVGDVGETASRLAEEFIFVEPEMRPNAVTFTMLIQMMAYLGHFQAVLDIFQDMITIENKEEGAPLQADENGDFKPTTYQPTVAVYRNIFLGFSRHGAYNDQGGWTLENLITFFERFLHLPSESVLTYSNVDIVMKAFSVTSTGDLELMREVWLAIEGRFGPILLKPSSTNRLMRLKMKLFPEHFSEQN